MKLLRDSHSYGHPEEKVWVLLASQLQTICGTGHYGTRFNVKPVRLIQDI
jgi:hypothetical protein